MPNSPLSIVIPVFNEQNAIASTVLRLVRLLGELPDGSEVILVNDGSTDETGRVLKEATQETSLVVLSHDRNRGYGAALKTGIGRARCAWVAIADADSTYPLQAIPKLLQRAEENGAAMVVGARWGKDQAGLRRFAKWFLTRLASHLAEAPIPDINSGLRVFRRDDALALRRLLPNGFSFTTTITMALMTEGLRVDFVPIRYRARVGRSKIRPVRDTANFALLICRTTLAFNPLRVFGPASALLLVPGGVLLVLRMMMEHTVGLATTIVLLVGGMLLLAIGLLADLINRRGPPLWK